MFSEHKENPYTVTVKTAEFFRCGFLKDTQIVVADSLVDEVVKMLLKFSLYSCNDVVLIHKYDKLKESVIISTLLTIITSLQMNNAMNIYCMYCS